MVHQEKQTICPTAEDLFIRYMKKYGTAAAAAIIQKVNRQNDRLNQTDNPDKMKS